MTISGNISSTEYSGRRAGLPANTPNLENGQLDTDDAVWPCGLVLGKDESGIYLPYAEGTILLGTGDGSETEFSDEVGPIEPGSASVVAGSVTLTDDGCGNLVGDDGSGTLNYQTGKVNATFDAAVANAAEVNLTRKPDPCAVLDVETDTAKTGSALVVRFGPVRKSELKTGVSSPVAATAAVIRRLATRHIYAA